MALIFTKDDFKLLGALNCPNPDTLYQQDLDQDFITYLGEHSDVRDFIASCYALVLPSYKEGIPRVLLEAMSMQKPIITSNVSGCKECILHPLLPLQENEDILIGQNGLLIPPKDPKALAIAIKYLAYLPSKDYEKMGKKSRELALKRFDISHTIEFYTSTLESYLTNLKAKHLVFVNNSAFGMYNFRLELLNALKDQGANITLIIPNDGQYFLKLQNSGFKCIDIKIDSRGLNPFKDLATIFMLSKLFKNLKPDFIFNYTIKPVIYGSIASKGFKNIAITTGLGYIFIKGGFLKSILKTFVCMLYKFALKNTNEVWFLNPDDKNEFLSHHLIKETKAKILDGEGISCSHFSPRQKDRTKGFLLIARMLKSKGVLEFIQAAKILQSKNKK